MGEMTINRQNAAPAEREKVIRWIEVKKGQSYSEMPPGREMMSSGGTPMPPGRMQRPYYSDPTANTAIAHIMREEQRKKEKPRFKYIPRTRVWRAETSESGQRNGVIL